MGSLNLVLLRFCTRYWGLLSYFFLKGGKILRLVARDSTGSRLTNRKVEGKRGQRN